MIFTINPYLNYLESIANVISTANQNNLKIILPTTSSCIKLQQIIVKNSTLGASILPNIVPIINIGIGSENIYDMPSNLIEPISSLSQRILLANIIQKHDPNITISQALDLSLHIIRLFDELTDHAIHIDELEEKTLSGGENSTWYDVAEHWRYRAEFLQKIYYEWQKTLAHYGKIDLITYRKNILNLEIEAAKNNSYTQILAGIFPTGPLVQELSEILAESENSYFIPPAMNILEAEKYKNTTSKTHYYYQLGQIVILGLDPRIHNNEMNPRVKLDDDDTTRNDNSLEYTIAENLRQESEFITTKISSFLAENPKDSIAIICKNHELINMCSNILDDKMISNINLNGYNIAKTKPYEFLILLMESYDAKHGINLEKFIILLKTHYLFSENIREFELELRKNSNMQSMPIIEEIKNIEPSLKSYIMLAEKLAPNLWHSLEGSHFSDFLYELLQIENIEEFAQENYIDFIKSVSTGAKYHKNIGNEQVKFTNLEDASICGYDYIILADMNEGSIPSKISLDPWMNNRMRENLGLTDMSEKIGTEWYYFKNLLYRKKIYITRSEKRNGVETQASRFLQELISSGALNVAS